jgi:dihydroxyacetone kinase
MAELDGVVRGVAELAVARRAAWDALDAAVGDGDFGTTLARGAGAVLAGWDGLDRGDDAALLDGVAALLGREMGGSSGPLWAAALSAAAVVLRDGGARAAAVGAAADAVRAAGGAAPGDKTVVDALAPAAAALADGQGAAGAARAAAEGAEATRGMRARKGRAAYAGERTLGAADPGAVAIAVIAAHLAGDGAPDTSALEAVERPTADGGDSGPRPTKQFMNEPDDVVGESLTGLQLAHPDLVAWDPARRIVVRAGGPAAGRVGVISGGGSGHEPMHAGFVGAGMLTAAAPGQVFASPTADAILAATRAADAGAGVLHVVKNYTGDVINFGQAAERAAAEGIEVATVLVDDDVAVDGSDHTVGRRGTGATLVCEKVGGALAEEGADLAAVAAAARRAVEQSGSFGIALTSSSPPGAGPILHLGPDEIELGVGIHGEAGRRRGTLRPADELVAEATEAILADLRPPSGARLLALVSGLGGTPLIEQHLVLASLARRLEDAGLVLARTLVGSYVTSLDMAGVLITLTRLDDELERLWLAPVHTPALVWAAPA